MGLFSGIADAQISERGKFFVPGFMGRLRVKRTLWRDTVKSGAAFIVEFEVLESNVAEHPVGSGGTWFQKMSDKTVAYPAIKAFAVAAFGYDRSDREGIERDISPNLDDVITHAVKNPDDNEFSNCEVLLETYSKKTQKGLDFTQHVWSPSPQA